MDCFTRRLLRGLVAAGGGGGAGRFASGAESWAMIAVSCCKKAKLCNEAEPP